MIAEIALFAAVIAALVSGGFTLANTKRLNTQALVARRWFRLIIQNRLFSKPALVV
jgi:hypothetical protein